MRQVAENMPNGYKELLRQIRAFSKPVGQLIVQKVLDSMPENRRATITWDQYHAAAQAAIEEINAERPFEPQLDVSFSTESMDAYRQGNWRSVQDVIDALQRSHSKTG